MTFFIIKCWEKTPQCSSEERRKKWARLRIFMTQSFWDPCWSASLSDFGWTDLHSQFLCKLVASWPYQKASASGPQVSLHFHSAPCRNRTGGTGRRSERQDFTFQNSQKRLETTITIWMKIFVTYPWSSGTNLVYNFLWIIISFILFGFYLNIHNSMW